MKVYRLSKLYKLAKHYRTHDLGRNIIAPCVVVIDFNPGNYEYNWSQDGYDRNGKRLTSWGQILASPFIILIP